MNVAEINKAFVIARQGKQFCLYAGLIDAAHRSGLRRLTTHLIQPPSEANGHTAIVSASALFVDEQGTEYLFTGIGDANPGNTGRMIALHAIRMAETRSKARALRDALNVGMTALEELADTDEDERADALAAHRRAIAAAWAEARDAWLAIDPGGAVPPRPATLHEAREQIRQFRDAAAALASGARARDPY